MPDLSPMSGPLGFQLVNDYFFRILLQQNNNVLKSLVASLLHMDSRDISSIRIENEIALGKGIQDKEFILDIRALMNDSTRLNIEMQVVNHHNWVERSMSYLFRTFDSLTHGEEYLQVKPAIQIGLLDYTLFPDAPEFFATYYLMNEKTHQKYSDKLRLSVLNLTRNDLATEEDKLYGIDRWAKLFKAKTWEDLKMLAQNDNVMADAVDSIYNITQDSILLEEIRAREERLALERRIERELAEKDQKLAEQGQQLVEQEQQLVEQKQQLAERDQKLAEKDNENNRLRNLLIASGINPDA